MIKHNKKRNVGLVRELFARYIAVAMIEHKKDKQEKAIKLIAKHFRKGTELQKEWMLFRTLLDTKITNKETAVSLVGEIKKAVKSLDVKLLEQQKSSLIHDINHGLCDEEFWNREVPNYKSYATAQILLSSWASSDKINENMGQLAELEDKLITDLLVEKAIKPKNKEEIVEKLFEAKDKNIDALVVKIMTEKFNKKYSAALNTKQKIIIQEYVFSKKDNNPTKLVGLMNSIRASINMKINTFLNEEASSEHLKEKLVEVKDFIFEEKLTDSLVINDETMAIYLDLAKLEEELMG